MIRFDSVKKSYSDGTLAVDGLSLEVPSGKVSVLVGPSGCGKTTALRMINRMIEPTAGRVLLNHREITSIPAVELRRGIGYVIQQGGLFPHKTVLDNIATVPLLLGKSKQQARSRAGDLLELVGLTRALAHRYPSQLSGGQQQRVGVARALAADPPIMLMDEPFSALDPVVREQLQDQLLRIQEELSKTIIFVTHDIDEAIKLGDGVAVMRVGGKLAQHSSPAELLSQPRDSFVAGFVGRDRGYRALSFTNAGALKASQEATICLGERLSLAVDRAQDGWILVLDKEAAPVGWLSVSGLSAAQQLKGKTDTSLLELGGTLGRQHGTLREALDAALSSPSGRGVIVDRDGRFTGTVTANRVLEEMEPHVPELREGALHSIVDGQP